MISQCLIQKLNFHKILLIKLISQCSMQKLNIHILLLILLISQCLMQKLYFHKILLILKCKIRNSSLIGIIQLPLITNNASYDLRGYCCNGTQMRHSALWRHKAVSGVSDAELNTRVNASLLRLSHSLSPGVIFDHYRRYRAILLRKSIGSLPTRWSLLARFGSLTVQEINCTKRTRVCASRLRWHLSNWVPTIAIMMCERQSDRRAN